MKTHSLSSSSRNSCHHSLHERFDYTLPKWASNAFSKPPHHGRLRLGNFPTPLYKQEYPSRTHHIETPITPSSILQTLQDLDIALYIKRDDLSGGCETGGNKIRKLEFLLADALAQDYSSVLTIGGIQSNHCRATAAASRMIGMHPHLILRTKKANEINKSGGEIGTVGNLLYDRTVGSTIYTCTPGEYGRMGSVEIVKRVANQIAKEMGKAPYPIPVGGSNGLGTFGYLQAVDEILTQWYATDDDNLTPRIPSIDHVVFACGSGGTACGLAIGMALSHGALGQRHSLVSEAATPPHVHAIGVCDNPEYFYSFVAKIAEEMGLQGIPDGMSTEDFVRQHMIAHPGKGLGYAESKAEELDFVTQFATETGIVLDPVYSGKALYQFVTSILKHDPESFRGSTVLFVHTGGSLGLYDKTKDLMPSLKQTSPTKRLDMYGKDIPNGMDISQEIVDAAPEGPSSPRNGKGLKYDGGVKSIASLLLLSLLSLLLKASALAPPTTTAKQFAVPSDNMLVSANSESHSVTSLVDLETGEDGAMQRGRRSFVGLALLSVAGTALISTEPTLAVERDTAIRSNDFEERSDSLTFRKTKTTEFLSESSTAVATNTMTTTGVQWETILQKASKRALGGGKAGASAAIVQVLSLMWLRTSMNYQYAKGGNLGSSLKALWDEGGIPRLYQGLPFALIQGPLTRFGDTAANVGILALLESTPETQSLPLPVKTALGSISAGLWRIVLMPIDASKTAMQVEGEEGLKRLWGLVSQEGLAPLYYGALAQVSATAAGHFPWFLTYNFVDKTIPTPGSEDILLNLARSALLGLCASCVSDVTSNSLRVIKTTKQTARLVTNEDGLKEDKDISYPEIVKMIVEKDGLIGLFGRGLQTRLLTNAIQGALFSVLWKYFQAQSN